MLKPKLKLMRPLRKLKDNDFEANTMIAVVPDWQIDGKVWATGWYVNIETNALSRATAKWAVVGCTFNLSRQEGKTTKLLLKRQGDWANPLILKEKTNDSDGATPN